MNVPRAVNTAIDRWLTAPEVNAAGRIGLYRIIYGLFYLWTMQPLSYYTAYARLPEDQWDPIATISWLEHSRPAPFLFHIMPLVLVVSLVLLTIGFRTRLATLLVLIAGTFLTGAYYSFTGKVDHGNTFMVVYIPAIMLFSRWGDTYSLDSVLKARRAISVSSKADSWVYIWPMRAILLLLSLMFFGAGYFKLRGGDWFGDMNLFPSLLINQNAIAVIRSFIPNPLNHLIADIPLITIPLQFGGILFELCFPLAILNHRWRNLFVSTGLLFHAFNVFFLNIIATPMIILYLLFVDWQTVYERLWLPLRERFLRRLSTPVLIALLIMVVLLWTIAPIVRPSSAALELRSIWYVVTPIALAAFLKSAFELVGNILRLRFGLRRDQAQTQAVQ